MRSLRSATLSLLAVACIAVWAAPTASAGPFAGCNATSLSDQDLSGCDLREAIKANAPFGANTPPPSWSGAQGNGLSLSTLSLEDKDLRSTDLSGALWLSTRLNGSNLSGAKLTGGGFYSSDLTGTTFSGAVGGTIGGWSILSGADLGSSDLTLGANEEKGSFRTAFIGRPATMPRGFIAIPSRMVPGVRAGDLPVCGGNWVRRTIGNKVKVTIDCISSSGDVLWTCSEVHPDNGPVTRQCGFNDASRVEAWACDPIEFSDFGQQAPLLMITRFRVTGTCSIEARTWDGRWLDFYYPFGRGQSLRELANRYVGALPGKLDTSQALTGENLTGADLSKTDLSSAILEGSDLTGSDLSDSTLSGVDTGGTITPSDVASVSASASAVRRPGAKLFRAKLTGANINKAKLRYAGLAGIITGNLKGKPTTLPTGWMLAKGYLIGPKANLTGANLNGVNFKTTNLKGTNLTGADITGANLGSAKLTGIISSNLIGKPAKLPRGWKVKNGQLTKG